MWVATNKGFLSIVQDYDKPGNLLVRARGPGHLQAIFGPGVVVHVTPTRDYLYRASIPAKEVAEVIRRHVEAIDYDNFKDSVRDNLLHRAYAAMWRIMARYQRQS
jgi:hypothetical protein